MLAETPQRPPAALPPDEELLQRSRAGDRHAFGVMVERHQAQVTLTVSAMLGRGEEVDDVVQEVFVTFFANLHRYRGEASITTYLKRIAVTRSLDALRRRKRWRLRFTRRDDEIHPIPEPGVEDRPVLEHAERAALLRQALDGLPDKYRAVVVLRLIEEYSTEETAELLQIPYGTVLSRLSRALQSLKHRLQPRLQEIR